MKVACVIPAYNEEKTISDVLRVVKEVDLIDEIIVVSDGSTDDTAEISKSFGVKLLDFKENRGKGAAVKSGVESTDADVIVFLDADLIGLNKEHIIDLISPVINESVDMTIGIFGSGRFATDLAQKVAPNLSGQRAVKRMVLSNTEGIDMTRYGVEIALTKIVERENYNVKTVLLKDMTHIMKEEKLGFAKGFASRMKMYWDIIKCMVEN